jgi:hypothetical protein
MTGTTADVLRIIFVIVPGFAVVGMAVMALRLYWVYYRNFLTHPGTPKGKMAYHVWCISLSHVTLTLGAIFDTIAQFHHPLTWRLPVFTLANALAIVALVLLVKVERQRLNGNS